MPPVAGGGLGLRTVINSLLPPLLQHAARSRQPPQEPRSAGCPASASDERAVPTALPPCSLACLALPRAQFTVDTKALTDCQVKSPLRDDKCQVLLFAHALLFEGLLVRAGCL